MPLTTVQLSRAQAFLKMMGSAHEGERNNAAGLLHKLMKDAGISDADIPAVLGSKPVDPPHKPEETPWDERYAYRETKARRTAKEAAEDVYRQKREEQARAAREEAQQERKASSTTAEWIDICAKIRRNSFSLNSKEETFVISLLNQLENGSREYPTPSQARWLRDIYRRTFRNKECPL